ncbi:DUF3078 domain-containing protein [Flammeovirgaceae bacterium SG7u.111]|nr:DUF3078 domain-containing protein [Flammeovirgaceae bacterium SG7u.132]WPO35577.1 DUF3078 domain-containing protein [Flammeovirgaceae bacterium SG7u.111]
MKYRFLFFTLPFLLAILDVFAQKPTKAIDTAYIRLPDTVKVVKDTTRTIRKKPYQIKTVARDENIRLSKVSDSLWLLEEGDSVYLLSLESASRKLDLSKKEPPPEVRIWDKNGIFNINFANVGLSNWAAGGQSSISLSTALNFTLKRETDASIWNNTLQTAFGISRIGNKTKKFTKSDDAIQVTTQYSLKIDEKWSVSGKLDFSTQYADGFKTVTENDSTYDELISAFMAPGRIFISSGIQFQVKEENLKLNALLSPLSGKLIYVLDKRVPPEDYGLDEGSTLLREIGIQFNGDLTMTFKRNITLNTALRLFSGLDRITKVDINWTTNTQFKINRYLNANFSTHLIYDEDITIKRLNDNGVEETLGPRVQFKHVLNLGVAFKF